jgi:AcrR family transcriptional regulator
VHAEDGVTSAAPLPLEASTLEPSFASTELAKRIRRGPGSYDRSLSADERRDEQREILIDASTHVFAEQGYARASVASILEASGLSRGTFYRHFKDLHEIFLAVQENAGDILVTKLASVNGADAEPLPRLQASIETYLTHCAEHGDLSRVFHQEALVNGDSYAALRRRCIDQIQDFFRSGLRLAVDRGQIRRMPDDLTIYAVIIAIEGVARKYLADHREHQLRETYEPLLRVALRAFT